MRLKLIISIVILFNFHYAIGQLRNEYLDSVYFSKIPYDSIIAKHDLKKGKIQILFITSTHMSISLMNTQKEFDSLEVRFGFKYNWESFDVPPEYIQIRADEYNEIVYSYLDSILLVNSKEEIEIERKRLCYDRIFTFKETDKEIKKRIKKTLRGETSAIKKAIIESDILFRNKKFSEALTKYSEVEKNDIHSKTKKYLATAIYHCYLQLDKREKALEYLNQHEKDYINRKIKR